MEGFRDRADDAVRKAGAPALRRIAADARKKDLSEQVRRLLGYLGEHLFDPELNVGTWCREAKVGDTAVRADFRAWFGVSMKDYYKALRLETGARMLAATDLDERQISRALGFPNHRSFWNLYKEWTGKTPAEGRDLPVPWLGPVRLQRALRGELTAEELDRFIAELHRLHPHLQPVSVPRDADPAARIVDGGAYERFLADELWQRIRALPFDEQKQEVRSYRFLSTVFFDLLRKKSREEGRRDRKRGVRIARLALASLEGHDEVFGDRIHDLRALAWAYVADGRRLMLDFDGAERNLASSDDEWVKPRAMTDLRILAEVLQIRSALRMCQRRYAEARESVGESLRLAELVDDAVLQAQALVLRASVCGYTERLQECASDLRDAMGLIDVAKEPVLSFKISLNQANVEMRLGNLDAAAASLSDASCRYRQLDYPISRYEVQHLQGNLSEMVGDTISATDSYVEALDGFLRAGDSRLAVLVALDLAALDSRHGERRRALDLAKWSVPILETMNLHEETIAAIDFLARESAASRIDQRVLVEVARLLRLDPLVSLAQETRAGREPRPSSLRF